ncbi:hypothetical protein A2331_02865 [Candidatus Falkowbacteria bacterium RIFOXYB2_FULL_34_18]|uniref:Uncharacterized protein n=1 Tax=Candidatus Falkowbacteria bacterium RIFOXYD2_FULL_34_120 TaxID=1798007 RepID=A0A1F5TNK8_9BACT|nr:MAG: hypothetical protein A2331_02865 [Candidatus Falkowbacteria bacterium RIFOXYB2_FULL_34_18]OGF28347.1 MAG: hypothetical protein A2500_03075 [Candidatus Falkowbacteria bacterium RIFOXYC12_FULL_34_55]OGF37934.1 MAG: hypothetical protein A2466_06010 [Candidatus Falkowbacteria bacterium RIFOXYC2_FULL_34_220]OGF39652.1 MAG: hypothetical protein A2515_07305 [Candidatus Falkowbacteria bacterium RIFOXYD12_FULL_34_57]OGF40091.1 MAG: hypothetical protein A2531_05000 [Candidatus Falkowbacteria bact
MPSPTLSRKSNQSLTLSENAKRLFQVIYHEQNQEEKDDDEIPKIKVSELVSKMSFYYEKIRNMVDYEEEYLLRKNAIERILRRQIVIEGKITEVISKELNIPEISKHLITELISAAYLPNNKIPESKINEISKIINKYLILKKYFLIEFKDLKINEKNEIVKWIIALLASDIEENLGRSRVDLTVVDYMFELLAGGITLPKNSPYEDDRKIQIFIGIYRNFLKFDQGMMSHILFKYYNRGWSGCDERAVESVAKNIIDLKDKIQEQINHPLAGQLNRIISRYTVFFSMLVDAIEENPEDVYTSFKNDPKALDRSIKKVCKKKYGEVRKKLWRAAIRSIIYIFITKSVFAIALEVPANKWLGEELNAFSLLINIAFPAILLFFVVLFTKFPSDDNSVKVVSGIEGVIFLEKQEEIKHKLRKPAKRSAVLHTIFGLIYAVTFFLSFGAIIWALDKINFSWVSMVIFLFFLAFVSFFSIRIRKGARELMVLESKEKFLTLLIDFFYVPIIEAGKWLSEKFSKINVFVFIMDVIIEAPFKIFITVAEEWTKYVRERKDEI